MCSARGHDRASRELVYPPSLHSRQTLAGTVHADLALPKCTDTRPYCRDVRGDNREPVALRLPINLSWVVLFYPLDRNRCRGIFVWLDGQLLKSFERELKKYVFFCRFSTQIIFQKKKIRI